MVFNTLGEDVEMEWVRIDSTIVRAQPHVAGAKKGSKTKHEDGLVAAFLGRSMRLVMRSAPLPFNGRRNLGLHASPGTFGWDGS
jgi:hypothetical protein